MRTLSLLVLAACGAQPTALPGASITSGTLPLLVTFEAAEAEGTTGFSWDFGDGSAPATGRVVDHTFVASGSFEVALTASNNGGATDVATLTIEVAPETCPQWGASQLAGNLGDPLLVEAAGLVVSRAQPGVLWAHNEQGDGPFAYAMEEDGTALGSWRITGASTSDWEDMALGADGRLYFGDIGDNTLTRTSLAVHAIAEPEPGDGNLDGVVSYELTYPDGSHDAETLLVDPQTGDVLILTKSTSGVSGLYRMAAPLASGTLEKVGELTFGVSPLSGNRTTTGGDISTWGNRIVIRTYTEAWLWLRDGNTVAEALTTGTACKIDLLVEPQGEAIAFGDDGDTLFTTSQGDGAPIYRYEAK